MNTGFAHLDWLNILKLDILIIPPFLYDIPILKNTLTPLHDHVRKNKGWSDTQVVFRFAIYQIILIIVAFIVVDYI